MISPSGRFSGFARSMPAAAAAATASHLPICPTPAPPPFARVRSFASHGFSLHGREREFRQRGVMANEVYRMVAKEPPDTDEWRRMAKRIAEDCEQLTEEDLAYVIECLSRPPSELLSDIGDLYRSLEATLISRMASFKSHQLKRIVASYALVGVRLPKLLDALADRAARTVEQISGGEYSSMAGAFARLNHQHFAFFDAIADRAIADASDDVTTPSSDSPRLSSIDITHLLYAHGHLNIRNMRLFKTLGEALQQQQQLAELTTVNAALALNACARVGHCDAGLFDGVADRLLGQDGTKPISAEDFEARHVVLMLNSFSRCNMRRPAVFKRLTGLLLDPPRVQTLSPQQLAIAVHALAKVDALHRPFMEAVGVRATECAEEFQQRELGNLLWGFAKLGYRDRLMTAALLAEVKKHAESLDDITTAQVLDAMRRFDWRGDYVLNNALRDRFLTSIETSDNHNLTQSAWCLTELDAFPQHDGTMGRVLKRLMALQDAMATNSHTYIRQLVRTFQLKYSQDFAKLPQPEKDYALSMVKTERLPWSARENRGMTSRLVDTHTAGRAAIGEQQSAAASGVPAE
ncbi:unnamed protein product [Vitrella brassicaformis CCMP3155]|uniref:RNA-editing substrate-binding complex 6 protein domain-containing protein n=1 Tax=Vitrella brassicaformis (strain CCMP3155) TaxID=1169540 RepID=A0A0G4EEQ5_VITBC|nr:unnamed protein product [Vitrella brassicaformis CCMP3155]|eukprot:CEL93877.1 unnamed protein product [Vitrella brassicaformis CCMP3155]